MSEKICQRKFARVHGALLLLNVCYQCDFLNEIEILLGKNLCVIGLLDVCCGKVNCDYNELRLFSDCTKISSLFLPRKETRVESYGHTLL